MFFLFKWISCLVHTIEVKLAPLASSILQVVKGAEDTGILNGIATLIDGVTHGHIATEVNDLIKKNVVKGLAVSLAINDLPVNPTPDQVKIFETELVTALASKAAADSIVGQSYTNLGATVYSIIEGTIADAKLTGGKLTFAQVAIKLEEAYKAMLKAKADAATQATDQNNV